MCIKRPSEKGRAVVQGIFRRKRQVVKASRMMDDGVAFIKLGHCIGKIEILLPMDPLSNLGAMNLPVSPFDRWI